jgi:hypothetical protein
MKMLLFARLLSTKPAADPALGLRSFLLDRTVEGIHFLHSCLFGVFAILFKFSFGFGGFSAGFVYLWGPLVRMYANWEYD